MDKDTQFYMHIGEEEVGPFGFAQLPENGLTEDTLVWWQGAPNWQRAGDVTELEPLLMQSAQAVAGEPATSEPADSVSRPTIHCPYCGEEILAVARKCRYCNEWLRPDEKTEKSMTGGGTDHSSLSRRRKTVLGLIIGVLALVALSLVALLVYNKMNEPGVVVRGADEPEPEVEQVVEERNVEETPAEAPAEVAEPAWDAGHPLFGYSHEFEGYMPFGGKNYPIKVTLDAYGGRITNVVYTNVTYGGQIRMTCTEVDERINFFSLEGKAGSKDFSMHLSYDDYLNIEGVAWEGDRQLQVYMHPTCTHVK